MDSKTSSPDGGGAGSDRWCGGTPVLAVAAGIFLLILIPFLSGRDLLVDRDMLQNYWPMKAAYWGRPGGVLPLWNPDFFEGVSYLGDVVQQPFYPPNIAFRLFRVPAPTGIAWYLALHGLLGLASSYALARRMMDPAAAAIAAGTFILSGFMVSILSTDLQFYCAYVWMPLVIGSLWRLGREPSRRSWAFAALVAPAPLLAGDPQAFMEAGAIGGALFLAAALPDWKRALGTGAALACAVGLLAGPQVHATLQWLPDLFRGAELEKTGRLIWSFHPLRIAEFYVPRLFGPLFVTGFWGGFTITGPWTGNYVHSFYAGALLPALVVAAARGRPRAPMGVLALSLLFTWFASGKHSFGYALLLRAVPGWSFFRYPERLMVVPAMGAAMLLGLGARALCRLPRGERLALIGSSIAFALVSLGACVHLAPENPWLHSDSRAGIVRSLAQLFAVGVAGLLWTRIPDPRKAWWALVAILFLDLAAGNHDMIGRLPREMFRELPRACPEIRRIAETVPGPATSPSLWRVIVDGEAINAEQPFAPPAWEGRLSSWGRLRWNEYHWGIANVLNLCGFHYSAGLTSLSPLSFRVLWELAGTSRALDAASTRFVVTRPGGATAKLPEARVRYRDPSLGLAIVELTGALPRLYRPREVVRIPLVDFLAEIPKDARLLSRTKAALEPIAGASAHFDAARWSISGFEDRGDALAFVVRHDRPGYWILTDAFDPSWRAWVDGAPQRIERADLRHRAVWIPAGSHRVRMEYRPQRTLLLAVGALVVACVLAALAAWPGTDGTEARGEGASARS